MSEQERVEKHSKAEAFALLVGAFGGVMVGVFIGICAGLYYCGCF